MVKVASSRGHNRIKSNNPIISLFITLQVLTFKGTLPPYPSTDDYLLVVIISVIISTYYFKIIKKCHQKSPKIEMLKIEITLL